MTKHILILAILLQLCGCTTKPTLEIDKGVSLELAKQRALLVKDVKYDLSFVVPSIKDSSIKAMETIKFVLENRESLLLDFSEGRDYLDSIEINGESVEIIYENEHIVLSEKYLEKGENVVKILFTAPDKSLNRNNEYLYTLLVPDRARSLFPCFDQPNIKAKFTLRLTVPLEWEVVSNGQIVNQSLDVDKGVRISEFSETEPLPTYLFSFVTGKLQKITEESEGRSVTLYHRESDEQKQLQCKTILDEVFGALKWMEEYTSIKYPFTKYDLIILPGFQYGGMEHAGATLYADRTMFLEPNATKDDFMSRSMLIAHETAHMWFGDLVTMKWFDDVWMKEVFANYFASEIVRPIYGDINHDLNFLNSNYPQAVSEDRTDGSNPIKQNLDNLSYAGLVYGSIIYNKAPIVFRMLAENLGPDKFRAALTEYLKTYSYSNADWDDLIEIIGKHSERPMDEWSRVWIKERGLPKISITHVFDSLIVEQEDLFDKTLFREQKLRVTAYEPKSNWAVIKDTIVDLSGKTLRIAEVKRDAILIANSDGKSYCIFTPDSTALEYMKSKIALIKSNDSKSQILKFQILSQLYESVWQRSLSPGDFLEAVSSLIVNETNKQIFSRALSYSASVCTSFDVDAVSQKVFELSLMKIIQNGENLDNRVSAFRVLSECCREDRSIDFLVNCFLKPNSSPLKLSERDLTRLCYELSIRLPERYEEFKAVQKDRITGVDRLREFNYIVPAVSPISTVRDSVFNSFLNPANREIEPWTITSLSYLNHSLRDEESVRYLSKALFLLPEIRETGDIFFPRNWCRALLSGHKSKDAANEVQIFLEQNRDLNPMLAGKIKQNSKHLMQ